MEWREINWPRPLDRERAIGLLAALAADAHRGGLVWELRAEAGRVRHLLGAEHQDLSPILSLIRRLIPEAIISTAAPRAEVERGGRVVMRQRSVNLPLNTPTEALRAVLAAADGARGAGDVLVLQVVVGRALAPEILPATAVDPATPLVELLTSGPRHPTSDVRTRMQSKLSSYRFRTSIRLGVTSPSPVRRRLLVHAMLAALRTLQAGGTQIRLVSTNPSLVDQGAVPLRLLLRLTPDELLPMLAWPTLDSDLPGLAPVHPRLIPPPSSYRPSKQRVFATGTAPGAALPVGIDIGDALRHTHVYGPTGAGKSTLLLRLIAADIAAGRSVVVIDPKRDLVMDTLAQIPEDRRGEVVVVDPSLPRSAGINPFSGFDTPDADARRPLVADSMLDLFRGLFPTAFGPLTSDTLHASFLTLTYAPDASLARLPHLFTDASYRRRVLTRVTDPALLGFWAQFEAKSAGQQAAAIGPVMTRLRQYLLRPGVRAVLEQENPRFNMAELFTQSRVLVVSLNKGLLGTQTASLLGSLVVAQLWQLILARAALPADERPPVSIYIDEAQNFLHLGDLAEALEQSRSLGAAWHLAHQHRAQMPDKLLRAIDANARNKLIFGLEDDEARTAARLTGLDADDFTRLPPHEIYLSIQHRGARTGWFSARVLPPPKAISSPEAIIAESQARFGADVLGPEQLLVSAAIEDEAEPLGRVRREEP